MMNYLIMMSKVENKNCIQDVTISDPFKRKPTSDHTCKGIIFGVNPEIMEEDIAWETHAKQAHRIVKFIGGRNIQTLQIILTFDDELPSHVFIGWQRYRVDKYIPDPIRCFRCQRYGHLQSQCKSIKEVCAICAQNHKAKECPEKIKQYKERKAVCANCSGHHPVNYMGCKKYELARETTKIQFSETKKISYAQAAMKLKEIKSRENNQVNQKIQINDQSDQEIENNSNKIQYKNDEETHKKNMIDQTEITTNENTKEILMKILNTKEKSNKTHEECSCLSNYVDKKTFQQCITTVMQVLTNCVDKEVIQNFLEECQSNTIVNQSNEETLEKLRNTISRLAEYIRGSKSSLKTNNQNEQIDQSESSCQ